jgi:hypothetical protein
MSPTHLPPLWLPGNLLNYLHANRHRDLSLSTHVTIRICGGSHMSRRAVPAPGHCPETTFQPNRIPNVAEQP